MKPRLALVWTFLFVFLAVGCASQRPVHLGIDVLRDDHYALLAGKRVGLVCNPASVDRFRTPTITVLRNAPNVNLVALYGAEHGVWGDDYAGNKVEDKTDAVTGLPVYSLYSKTKLTTQQKLAGVDVVVFDLQDIGSRSFTYINTMKQTLLACAEADKELIILDRPNPLGGERIEGGPVESKKYRSGVSSLDVPYVHGMTMGELALMTRDALVPNYRKLHVVRMSGWHRDMTWADTGLDWIMPSPHVPHVSSVAAYAATGILGELYQVSNGVGYTLPFECVGSPTIDGYQLADRMNRTWPNSPGIYFRPMRFKPFYATHAGQICGGVQVHIDPHTAPSLVEINYRLIEAIDGPGLMAVAATPTTLPSFGDAGDQQRDPATRPATQPATTQATTSPATSPATTRATTQPTSTRRAMFDKVTGGPEAGDRLAEGESLEPMFQRWRDYCARFRRERRPYLLY